MESAGERLKKIRQEKGISLEEAHNKTKIHLDILKAIEGDSLTNLNPVYLRGFFKIYCNFLGVNPNEYIPGLKQPTSQVKAEHANEKVDTFLKSASIKIRTFRPTKGTKRVFIFILTFALIWIILFNLGKFISSRRNSYAKKQRPSVSVPIKNEKAALKSQEAKTQIAQLKSPNKYQDTQRGSVSVIRLGIRARENCWVSLKIDGRSVFQRVLEKGRYESWEAKDKMELSLGNAGAVELEVNGQVFSNLGKRGEAIKNILITKEGLKTGR
jgi:cytoskeletal protein RodZ